ncbi:ribonuclease H-like domain-containing protein [Tanacetum coccineum]
MFLSQRKYVVEILERDHMVHFNPSRTPIDTESKLGVDGNLVSDPTLYRSLAGALQYLAFTRPNISYAVQQIGLVALLLDDQFLVIVYFLAKTYVLVPLSLNRRYLVLVLRHSIVVLPMLLLRPVGYGIFLAQQTKHIEIDIHFVCDLVVAGHVSVLHVLSRYQYANIFTRGLSSALFEEFHISLSVWCLSAQTVRKC